ncbi:MAG: pilus (MSHA type) biogenesis protein MshL [Pseudomonadota bacterium]
MSQISLLIWGILLLLTGCGAQPIASADRHIRADAAAPVTENIPQLTRPVPLPPPPQPQAKTERYSVVVNNIPVQELLFALARDAKVNVDVHPGIEGRVTINAIDQTLPQILARVAKQVDMRFELDGPNLVVRPDSPYLKSYKIDYVNMSRDTTETIALATQISSTGTGASSGGGGQVSGNNSTTTVTNISKNRFWETLIQNVKDILRETDKLVSQDGGNKDKDDSKAKLKILQDAQNASKKKDSKDGTDDKIQNAIDELSLKTSSIPIYREAASVIANPETGVISVRANGRQHEKIQEFLSLVMGSAKRQVLIEATIAEVILSDEYQAGVDWSRIVNLGNGKLTITQSSPQLSGDLLTNNATPTFTLGYAGSTASQITAAVRLLSTFGNTRVLSSPKIMVLNNQSAILKVVNNHVYFEVKAETVNNRDTQPVTTFTTTAISVPIGLVMNVTPQIGDDDAVSLNVRPTISSITNFVVDPNPALLIANRVPEIQSREIESVLRVSSGQIAIMGGLMEDSADTTRRGVPGLSDLPIVGDAFSYRKNVSIKKELVIFLRPTIIREANAAQILQDYQGLLPDKKFFPPNNPTPAREAIGKQP